MHRLRLVLPAALLSGCVAVTTTSAPRPAVQDFVPVAGDMTQLTFAAPGAFAPAGPAAVPAAQGGACIADPEQVAQQMALLDAINAERRNHGLSPVRLESRLANAAHGHACESARINRISHQAQDGSRPGHRALRAGYDYRTVVENLGLGFHSAGQAMFYWMRSPGHRKNVLAPEVRDAALGLTMTSGGQRAWVLMMGSTRRGG